jgi:hypothetical protein
VIGMHDRGRRVAGLLLLAALVLPPVSSCAAAREAGEQAGRVAVEHPGQVGKAGAGGVVVGGCAATDSCHK